MKAISNFFDKLDRFEEKSQIFIEKAFPYFITFIVLYFIYQFFLRG
ncbi:MAG: hypothetical protein RLY43_1449 [Bacteroidota bacterium]|jgi:hypothetical protein